MPAGGERGGQDHPVPLPVRTGTAGGGPGAALWREGTGDKYPAQLSGGMRQRAALLRTFLGSQGVVLLDEPFSALDALTKREIHRWYMGMMDQLRLTTLFITHDIDEAILLSDRIYILSGRPGTITTELTVQPPRPRSMDFALSGQFLEYKKQILALLEA